MALIGNYASLPVIVKYSDLPAEGAFDGYQVIIASLGRVAKWDGSAWSLSVSVDLSLGLAADVSALAGTLTGTVDGTIADVANIATAGGATPTAAQVDTAVNGAILSLNLQLKELQVKLNALIAAFA